MSTPSGKAGRPPTDTADELQSTFAHQVGALRRAAGLSQAALAKRLDVDPGSLNRWLAGKTLPNEDSAKRLDIFARETDNATEMSFLRLRELCQQAQLRQGRTTIRGGSSGRHSPEDDAAHSLKANYELSEWLEVHKIATVRWDHLTDQEQRALYEGFSRLQPRFGHTPISPVVSARRQEALGDRRLFDPGLLREFLQALGLPCPELTNPPYDDATYSRIRTFQSALPQRVATVWAKGPSEEQRLAFIRIYEYLSCVDLVPPEPLHTIPIDALFVKGARRSFRERVDRALDIYAHAGTRPTLILSGSRPRYQDDSELCISEAEAMNYYLTSVRRKRVSSVILETHSRSIRDATHYLLPILQGMRLEVGRPITLALVTGPSAARRLLMSILHQFEGYEHVLDPHGLLVCPSDSSYSLSDMLDPKIDLEDVERGFTMYLTEFFKILGGRATGEF